MDFSGQFSTRTPTETAAKILTDVHSISQCLPNLGKLEVVSDDEFFATFKVDLSDIAGRMRLDYLSRLSVRMHFKYLEKRIDAIVLEGTGRAAGSKLDITLHLKINQGKDESLVAWTAQAEFGPLLKLLGDKIIRDVSTTMIDGLTDCLTKLLNSSGTAATN